jgi:hypothetical protein
MRKFRVPFSVSVAGCVQDLEPLGSFPKLTLLSLTGNPVQTKPNYR